MGRRDAVQVVLEVVARCRQILPGLLVSYEPGWETRGNGTSANYEGGLVHHTASPSTLLKPFPSQTVLRQGRSDLPGPLCNMAGPACTVEAPRLHVMGANPANHAGASGGRSMGPLPTTSLFNPRVLGLEIDYAGSVPMLAGQLLVAQVWARAVADVVGGGDIERVRAHYETSVTGKWDIGAGAGSVDMATFRRQAADIAATHLEDDMYDGNARAELLKELGEIKRMTGVLVGWPGAATDFEVAAQRGPADAAECRRMLGVILGWTAPATEGEAAALAKLWDTSPDQVTVNLDPAIIAAAIPRDIAQQVVDLLGQRLAA